MVGSQVPRLWTPRRPDLPSFGPAAVDLASVAGIDLDPWQQLTVDVALEYDPETRLWTRRTVVYVVARQNGKTVILKIRVLAGLFLFDDRLITHTAQDRAVPRELFEDLVTVIGDTPALHRRVAARGIRETNGQERIKLKDGSTYKIVAPRPKSFRGPSSDVIIFDEIREHHGTDLWGAALPAQSAAPNPQIWATSNDGDLKSVQLHRLKARGRDAVEAPDRDPSIAYLEWSVPDDAEPSDETTWRWANPGLGTRISMETIREELVSMTPGDFETERLCRSVPSLGTPAIPWPAWEKCGGSPPPIAEGLPRPVMGIQINGDRTRAELAIAVRRDDRLIVDIVDFWDEEDGIDQAAITAKTLEVMKLNRVKDIAFDRAGAATIAQDIEQKGLNVHPMTPAEYVIASQNLFDAVTTGDLFHRNDPHLNDQVAGAARRIGREESWHISQSSSNVPITGVLALAFAVNLAYRPEQKGGFRWMS